MTTYAPTAPFTPATHSTCANRLTKTLLAYGVIAGPVWCTVAFSQAVSRDAFDVTRHPLSLLSNGPYGWIQVINFVVAGLMLVACGAGLRRALTVGRGSTWIPRLIGAYGASLVAAGVFRADPAAGFPSGTPTGPAAVSWHGMLHFVSGGIGFTCVAIACFITAARYAERGRAGYARFSRVTGAVFLAGFAAISSGGGSRISIVTFTACMLLLWTWLSSVALDQYRSIAHTSS
jgi:hypothetical membrane protein